MAMTKTNIAPLELGLTPSEAPAATQCAKCGKPFIPTFTPPPGQPVYCPHCYKNHQNRRRPTPEQHALRPKPPPLHATRQIRLLEKTRFFCARTAR